MRNFVIIGAIVLAGMGQLAAAQNDAPGKLEAQVKSLDAWLGTDANGNTWRSYLLLKRLQAEIGGDHEANPQVLVEAWRRFSSGEAGLEHKRFRDVRATLEEEINHRLRFFRDQIATLAKDAQFSAPGGDFIARAEAEARQAAAAVNAHLARLPRAQGDAARSHFGNERLQALAAGRPVEDADLEALSLALDRYHWRVYDKKYTAVVPSLAERNEVEVEGLEAPVYTRLRNALRQVRNLRAVGADQDGKKSLQAAVDDLVKLLPAAGELAGKDPQPQAITEKEDPLDLPASITAAQMLRRLQASGQAPELVRAAVNGFSHPNLVGYASQDFFAGGLEQVINRVQPVHDNILGTDVHGTAHVVGATDVRMLTNPTKAGYRILLDATANSNTVGYNRVTIFSTGVTQLHGEKKIHFDDDLGGMRPSPATACATTCTSINGICARSRLVERIAWKRVMGSKAEAEAIAASRAAGRLRGEMDQQAVESTRSVNANFQDKYRRPLLIRGEYPREFSTASSSSMMQVVISQLGLGQLGAPDAPPATPAGDLALQLHESYVANFGRALLGGQEFTSLELRQMQEQNGGDVKSIEQLAKERAERAGEGTEPDVADTVSSLAGTYITFDDEIPVRVEFRKDQVLIVVRIKRLETDDPNDPDKRRLLVKGVEVSALYRLAEVDGHTVLQRDEDGVYAAYLAEATREEENNLRRLGKRRITDRFREDAFPVTIKLSPIDFSKRQRANQQTFGNWSKLPPMKATDVRSAGGWLSLGWSFPEEPPPTVEKKSAPVPGVK